MNYWIITLPREDMSHCIQIGTFGLNTKQALGRMKAGDKIVCCVTKEKPWKIVALGESTSEMFVDDKPIFKKPGGFYYRFNFSAKRLSSGDEINMEELMPNLSFITNIAYWPVYFKGGVKTIAEKDWKKILSQAPSKV